MASGRFDGKTAIVTGAAGGIGGAIVRAFCAEGARVLAADYSNQIEAAFSDLASVRPLQVDITSARAPQELVDCCAQELGGLDIVVNNAGVVITQPFEEVSDEAWEKTLAVNATAPFRISRTAVPHLKKRGRGRIINIGSTSSAHAEPEHASYCASKHALAGLSKVMALDLGKYGITVNYVLPGMIATPMTAGAYDPAMFEAWERGTALGRIGRPEDVASVVLFLASEDAGYMSGAGLYVDAGHSLHE